MFRILKPNSEDEQNILIGMIISDRYLSEITDIITAKIFRTPYGKIIAGWCLNYFKQYQKAPKETIQDMYNAYMRQQEDDDSVTKLIGTFLTNLSKKYENYKSYNVEYQLTAAERFAKKRCLEMLNEDIKLAVANDDIEEAEEQVLKYSRIERVKTAGVQVLGDMDILQKLYFESNEDEKLFQFHGAVGDVIGPLCRNELIAYAGPGKRGKSWWLIYTAIKAVKAKYKVLFVSLEMSQKRMLDRIFQALVSETRHEEEIDVPFFDDNNMIRTRTEKKAGLDFPMAKRKIEHLKKTSANARLTVISFPSGSATVSNINNYIQKVEQDQGWVPDIIIIDYADLLKPEIKSDFRNQIDHTWKSLRAMAHQKNSLVVTATHTSKKTFGRDIQPEDMSDDIRKLNHVSCMIALNQSPKNKKQYVMKIGVVAHRHREFRIDNQAVVLYNLKMGQPCLFSKKISEVKNLED